MIKYHTLVDLEQKRGVYIIRHIGFNMSYVGQSEDISKRIIEHFMQISPVTSNPLYLEIGSLDWSLFEIHAITVNDDSSLDELELNTIKKYNTIYPNGYNVYGEDSSVFKKWIQIDYRNMRLLNEVDSTGNNLLLSNIEQKKILILPKYILNYIENINPYSKFSLLYFKNYYALDNIIDLSDPNEGFTGKTASYYIKKYNILDSSIISFEKAIHKSQMTVNNACLVNLTNNFSFKDNMTLDFDRFLQDIINHMQNSTYIIKELYFKFIDVICNSVTKDKFYHKVFDYKNNNRIIVFKSPFIGYLSSDIKQYFYQKKDKEYDLNICTINEHAILFFVKNLKDNLEVDKLLTVIKYTRDRFLNYKRKSLIDEIKFLLSYLI